MEELIYNVQYIFQEYLDKNGCVFFNIPEYQRGYKWTAENVTQLLNDLKNFTKSSEDEFYCLQNITITKTNHNGTPCFNVIDGQQRLTTLFIIISFMQRNFVDKIIKADSNILKYSIRNTTDEFLRTSVLSGELWNNEINPDDADSKDKYYIMEVARAVGKWFEDNKQSHIEQTVLKDLCLIVNQVDSGEEETVFASLNGGKVDLDGADLVRAILITRAAKQKYPSVTTHDKVHQITNDDINLNINISVSSQGKINEYRVKLGVELDKMNLWWSDKCVRGYFEQLLPNRISDNKSFKYSEYPIDLLYYAFFEAYKEKLVTSKDERDLDLRFFENGIDLNGIKGDDHLEFYRLLSDFHLTMVDWYSDDEIFNLVGYLMYNYKSNTISFALLWSLWNSSKTKSDFKEKIKEQIRTQLAVCFSSESNEDTDSKLIAIRRFITDITQDWYSNKEFTEKFLPLLDILPIEKKDRNTTKLVINRVNPDYLKRLNKSKLESEDKEHVRSQTRQFDHENLTEEEAQALMEENKHGLNSIGNIVLLHQKINRSYGNDKHTLKMDRIANEFIINDVYIRPHTFRVFISKLKGMDNNGLGSDIYWSDEDILNNVKTIDEDIAKYLNLPEIPTSTTE